MTKMAYLGCEMGCGNYDYCEIANSQFSQFPKNLCIFGKNDKMRNRLWVGFMG